MKEQKEVKTNLKEYASMEEIKAKFFPREEKEQFLDIDTNPDILGESFASLVLKHIKR
ncbi:MAG: hypothetical protein PHE61_06840 [Candidatus Omnitrophica bacterium]|nr:hypothetical protein [Candidatus Omnitrophota bacterium]